MPKKQPDQYQEHTKVRNEPEQVKITQCAALFSMIGSTMRSSMDLPILDFLSSPL